MSLQGPVSKVFKVIDLASGKAFDARLQKEDLRVVGIIEGSKNLVVERRGGCSSINPTSGAIDWAVSFPSKDFYVMAVQEDGKAVIAYDKRELIYVDSTGHTTSVVKLRAITDASLSPDGKLVAVAMEKSATLFDVKSGLQYAELKDLESSDHRIKVYWLTNSRIAIIDNAGIRLSPVKRGSLAGTDLILGVSAVDREGKFFLIFEPKGWSLSIVNRTAEKVKAIKSWKMPGGYLGTSEFVPNHRMVITVSEDGGVRLWKF